jgi:thiamine-monophosphate kinase
MGPRDDCALLDGWLISTDVSVEGTHFRLDWSSLEEAIEKALLSNFSDINAMGGTTGFVLLGLCLNRRWDKAMQARAADAFAEVCNRYGVRILGGDTVVGDVASFSITVLGKCGSNQNPMLRSNAKVGDWLYVSGQLGASGAGLWALQNVPQARSLYPEIVGAHLVPKVPLGLGPLVLEKGEGRACIDISDGLSSELHHLALQSGVGIEIQAREIPVHGGVLGLCSAYGLSSEKFWLHGGEEYQLLFTSALAPSLLVLPLWPFEIHCIGKVIDGSGVTLVTLDGKKKNVELGAWSHL